MARVARAACSSARDEAGSEGESAGGGNSLQKITAFDRHA